VCAALSHRGDTVVHLGSPTDSELGAALVDVDDLAVLLHDDTAALRYCLAAEHLRPGLPMQVALFDRTAAGELVRVVPNCRVMSPADVALPSLTAACVSDGLAAVVRVTGGWEAFPRGARAPLRFLLPRRVRLQALAGRALGQIRPHDSGSRLLLIGLAGLLALLAVDTTAGILVLHDSPVTAFHAAVRTVATAGPVPVEEQHPRYLLFAALAMLTTIGLTAMFTAGIVEHLLSGRLVGLVGRRVIPQRGHVVVVGMGQVGLRLATELRGLGLAVVGVERDPRAVNIPTARAMGIPVQVGDASRRRVLERVRTDRALALCAVGSSELDNLSVSVTARAVAPDLRVVIRAGNHDAIAETQSLFRIGTVCDVTGLTAAYVVETLRGRPPQTVFAAGARTCARMPGTGDAEPLPELAGSCPHRGSERGSTDPVADR
jgi:hypothetical protein